MMKHVNTARNLSPAPGSRRTLSVLGIDDDPDHLFILETMIRKVDAYDVRWTGHTDYRRAAESLRDKTIDILIIDYDLRTTLATSLIDTLRTEGFDQPVLVLTGVGNETIATKAMKAGASDYIVKSKLSPELLRLAIDGALSRRRLEEEKAILERELLESQKLEALGTLVSGIGFEFNNLLTVILSEVELGLLEPPEQAAKHLTRIRETGYGMAEIVRRLVAFNQSSCSSGEMAFLSKIVADTSDYLSHLLPRTVQLNCHSRESDAMIHVRSDAIRRIMVNLALNASEAMPSGGVIDIEARLETGPERGSIPLPPHLRASRAVLEVRDNGVGISPDIRPRIFEPFFTTKAFTGERGAGLGLSMVWQLVQSMRGHIHVISTPGEGTTFQVILPDQADDRLSTSEPEIHAQNGETVLLVGGGEEVTASTEPLLQRLGYRVQSAPTGRAALEQLASGDSQPDVILLDLQLPDMDALAFARQAQEQVSRLAIVPVTGIAELSPEDERIESQCKGKILRRPVRPRDLGTRLRDALDG